MMPDSPSRKPDVLLFDLGGVLVHWQGNEPLVRLSTRPLSLEDARLFWLRSPWVRRFERGRCSPLEFAEGAIEELSLDVSPPGFLEEFLSWDRGPFPESLELLDALRDRFRLACLSNNNELHWQKIRDTYGFGSRFHHVYLSHEIGEMKPDHRAFEHVLADLAVPAGRILFFDDNPECVAAASELGLIARQVRGVDEVKAVLRRIGVNIP